ncbi:MAG: DUF2085 domain-containing protein [Polyangiaceae bacterium]|nr:DUF2085 domain-containing protein [Polyangiaceae bacterium]
MDGLARGDGASRQEATGEDDGLKRDSRFIYALRAIGVLIALSPFWATVAARVSSPGASELIYAIFSPVCHNRPARTLELFGVLMPLCSRCLGIFIGFGTAGVFPYPRWGIRASLGYGFVASVVMVADVIMQDLGMHPIWHSVRILTGILWGHVCGLGVLAVGRWGDQTRKRSASKRYLP